MEETMINTSTTKTSKVVFVDTSAHFAIANVKDRDHKKAFDFFKKLAKRRVFLLTTNFIVSETYTLMLRKIGRDKAVSYIEYLKKTAEIEFVSREDEKRAWEIIRSYEDKRFSYVDATSFAVMERLNIKDVFAFDDHFDQYGFNRLPKIDKRLR